MEVSTEKKNQEEICTEDENHLKAKVNVEPEEAISQRQFIKVLMPSLFVLRHKGFSFRELSKMLGELGIRLKEATLREYYSDFKSETKDACEKQLAKQLPIWERVRLEKEKELEEARRLRSKDMSIDLSLSDKEFMDACIARYRTPILPSSQPLK